MEIFDGVSKNWTLFIELNKVLDCWFFFLHCGIESLHEGCFFFLELFGNTGDLSCLIILLFDSRVIQAMGLIHLTLIVHHLHGLGSILHVSHFHVGLLLWNQGVFTTFLNQSVDLKLLIFNLIPNHHILLHMVAFVSLYHELLCNSGLIEVMSIVIFNLLDCVKVLFLGLDLIKLELVHRLHKLSFLDSVINALRSFLFFFPEFDDSCFNLNLLLRGYFILIYGLHHLVLR